MKREKLSKKENEQISLKFWRGNWVQGWKGLPMVDINIEKKKYLNTTWWRFFDFKKETLAI